MGKALIIAEKPSVASDIAKALGGFTKHDEYYESDQYVLSSAVGHLLELIVPEEFEVKRGKWTFAHLPIIPPHFGLRPIEKTESRLKVLIKLLKRKDVTELINACDAGREGELIFRYIVKHTKAKQPIKRLWLQSMTPAAIRDGFAQLRDDQSMRPLADAAVCRSESDWLVGINGTRAMTAFNSKTGGFHLTTVGRVQTPTLAILVEREEKIKKFVSKPYWEIHGTFDAQAGQYGGRWFDEKYGFWRLPEGPGCNAYFPPFPIQPLTLAQVEKANQRIKKYHRLRDLDRMPCNVGKEKQDDQKQEKLNWKLWLSSGEWSEEDELPDEDER